MSAAQKPAEPKGPRSTSLESSAIYEGSKYR